MVKVAVLNFSKAYSDYENPACVNINNALVVSMTVPHDILMTENVIETHVVSGRVTIKHSRVKLCSFFYNCASRSAQKEMGPSTIALK